MLALDQLRLAWDRLRSQPFIFHRRRLHQVVVGDKRNGASAMGASSMMVSAKLSAQTAIRVLLTRCSETCFRRNRRYIAWHNHARSKSPFRDTNTRRSDTSMYVEKADQTFLFNKAVGASVSTRHLFFCDASFLEGDACLLIFFPTPFVRVHRRAARSSHWRRRRSKRTGRATLCSATCKPWKASKKT